MSTTAVVQEVELSRLSSIANGRSNESQINQLSQDGFRVRSGSDYGQTNAASELPPVDTGFHAYAYLAGSFVLELLVWALPFSYGVFLNHYTSHHLFDGPQEFLLPLVGTLSSGIIYLTSIAIMPALGRYPHQRQNLMRFGAVLCVVSLLGAAFATQVWHLILTQGILYSVGGTILYFPVQIYLFEWFEKRRGLANGVIFSGTGLGGVILPFVVETLLNKYGSKTTFLSLAVGYSILLVSVLPFVKGRLPPSSIIIPQRTNWSFLWNPTFVVLFIGNFLQGLGNFVPGIWLPTFASDMKLSVTSGTLIVSLMNAAAVPGSIVIGFASDKYDLRAVMLVSMLGSSLAVLLLWGLASNLASLLSFALIYGFLAGGFSSLWPKFASTVAKDDPHLIARLMSIFIAGRGVGNVLAAPISSSLLQSNLSNAKYAYGLKNYGPLIIFTGIALFSSTIGIFYKSAERFTNRHLLQATWLEPSQNEREEQS
ncbi:MFS general substrate transporter [Ceratobasidium sp. AG-I]|nr:MFS general substrate transporter [Ceratobasidium sp. AG-I]